MCIPSNVEVPTSRCFDHHSAPKFLCGFMYEFILYIYIYIYIYIHTYIHIIYVCVYIYICLCMRDFVFGHHSAHMYACMCVNGFVRICTRYSMLCPCVHKFGSTHTSKHTGFSACKRALQKPVLYHTYTQTYMHTYIHAHKHTYMFFVCVCVRVCVPCVCIVCV